MQNRVSGGTAGWGTPLKRYHYPPWAGGNQLGATWEIQDESLDHGVGINGFLSRPQGGSLVGDETKGKATQVPLINMDEDITSLFQQWLVAFANTQKTMKNQLPR